ncbi:MAG: cyclic nucleotide-binding domain-containing protein [Deltaproteobacteria bacterium]|nr:cyclic nucleotide-binding domain-containing protein [Deltaproteobacteria bacterium]
MVESSLFSRVDFDWRNSPLFSFCENSDWELFLRIAEFCEVSSGSQLWAEGEGGGRLICVLGGSLEAVKKTPDWGKPVIMAEFLPGATVGELIFDDPGQHSTTLQVVKDARLLILEPEGAATLLNDFPATAARFWRGAAYLQQFRLRQANSRLATLF